MLREYLEENGIGFFCWTLNDNNFKTGSLFTCVQWSQRTEMAHAWRLTSDKHRAGTLKKRGPLHPRGRDGSFSHEFEFNPGLLFRLALARGAQSAGVAVLHHMARRSFNPMVRRPVVCSNPMVRVVPLARVSRRSFNPMAHAIVQHAGQRD